MTLSTRNLTYHYQPIIDMVTGRLSHYEALLRLMPLEDLPPRFLDRLDSHSLGQMDLFALRHAVTLLKRDPALALSINMTPSSIALPGFCSEALLLVSGITAPQRLIIEITETHQITCLKQMRLFLTALQDIGCITSLDDVGSGFAQDLSLLDLPLNAIKIDGSHIQNLGDPDGMSHRFVSTCIAMARDRGLSVTAEFIETTAQRDLVLGMGIRYGQGFLFGRATRQPWASPAARMPSLVILDTSLSRPPHTFGTPQWSCVG